MPGGKTFRNRMYDQYKAHRPEPPAELIPQFALIREATRAFGLPCIELEDWEADDLIAAYAKAAKEAGGEAIIVSSDKDLMQLLGPQVTMLDPMKNTPIGLAEVEAKFGVTPDKVIEVQALIGDLVDNVPGVPGIGPKGAAQLIQEYGTVEEVLEAAPGDEAAKRRDMLIEHAAKGADFQAAGDAARRCAAARAELEELDAAALGRCGAVGVSGLRTIFEASAPARAGWKTAAQEVAHVEQSAAAFGAV